MNLSDRAKAIAPFYAMAFGEKAAQLERQGHHVVKLNIGEPDFGAPKPVIDAMQQAVASGQLPYTGALGIPELRQAVARFYKTAHGVTVSPERVIITAGASAALMLVSAALVNPGDEVLINDPSYPCNRQFISTFGGQVNLIPTDASHRFQLDKALVAKAWTDNTKGVMVASPSNPTGTAVKRAELEAICAFAASRGGWRIIDEIYLNLALSDDHGLQTALAFDNDAIIINSFSKYFGMTGWRLGWCVVPESMVEGMEKLAQNLYICPSTPAQKAALACFSEASLAICEQRRQLLIERKNAVLTALTDMDLAPEVEPDGAFYVYINIARTGMDAMTFCDRLLQEAHVALTPGRDFGHYQTDNYVRLSFAASNDELKTGLTRIGQFIRNLHLV